MTCVVAYQAAAHKTRTPTVRLDVETGESGGEGSAATSNGCRVMKRRGMSIYVKAKPLSAALRIG